MQLNSGTKYSIDIQTTAVNSVTQVLSVSATVLEDSGSYTCVATNQAGVVNTSINLEVLGA